MSRPLFRSNSSLFVRTLVLAPGFFAAISCGLLDAYPNGAEPEDKLSTAVVSIVGGELQMALINPGTDAGATVVNLLEAPESARRNEGTFRVKLGFQSPVSQNVVGGGIRLPKSDLVQWTFVPNVTGVAQGELEFSFSVGADVCEGIPPLCHSITTEQFAITTNAAGGFMVSEPVLVDVVLQCASCESISCAELLTAGQCKACSQPQTCVDLGEACFNEGKVSAGTTEADIYKTFFGESGQLWSGLQTCVSGEAICQKVIDNGDCKFPANRY